ncbi:MAG: ribonuclease P protein component [Gemmatimonadaceae bacterium]|nr:ribonuclease P protein component [Gemmatimonadaceae bacterium]
MRAARLTRRQDLERIRLEGKALRTKALLVRVSSSPQAHLRVGIVVPRHRRTAVERNTLKRRLRELVRLLVLPLGVPMDLVIWAQRAAYEMPFDGLRQEIESLLPRLRQRDPRESP